jgi:hypothetical protein
MSFGLGIGFIFAVFVCFFLYVAIGMAVGTFQANMFLLGVLGFAAVIGGAFHWSRPRKNEPRQGGS